MTDAVETMAWTGETPWHGLGKEVNNKMTAAQMLKAAGLNWTVSKRPLYYGNRDGELNGEPFKAPDQYGLIRDSDDKMLSVVGRVYRPVQNANAFDFFKKFVSAGHMTMETAGSLWGGKYIWGLARIGKDFKLANGKDEVRGYLLLMSPHVMGKAMVFMFTPIRVVCWNTLNMALGADLRGGKSAFRVPHTSDFDDAAKLAAEEALGISHTQMEQFQKAATALSKKKAKTDEVEEYFCEVLEFDPEDANKKVNGEPMEPHALPKFRAALTHAPGAEMPSALGTWWGALNAVTFVADHQSTRSERATGLGLKNAWLGHQAKIKMRALDLALQRVQ